MLRFYLFWLVVGLLLCWLGWKLTRKIDDVRTRALIRSFVLAIAFAHIPFGGYLSFFVNPAVIAILESGAFGSQIVILGITEIFIFWLLAYVVYLFNRKVITNLFIVVLLSGYFIAVTMLAGSYWDIIKFIGSVDTGYGIATRDGSGTLTLLTLGLGIIVFFYLHFGSLRTASSNIFLLGSITQLFVGSLILVASCLATAKNLMGLTLYYGALVLMISWVILIFLKLCKFGLTVEVPRLPKSEVVRTHQEFLEKLNKM